MRPEFFCCCCQALAQGDRCHLSSAVLCCARGCAPASTRGWAPAPRRERARRLWRRLAQAASTTCTRCTARSLLTCPCLGSLLGFGPWERGEQKSCVAWLQARRRVSSSRCALSARPGVACTGVHCQMLRSGAQSAAAADGEGNLGAWPAGVNLAHHQQPVQPGGACWPCVARRRAHGDVSKHQAARLHRVRTHAPSRSAGCAGLRKRGLLRE